MGAGFYLGFQKDGCQASKCRPPAPICLCGRATIALSTRAPSRSHAQHSLPVGSAPSGRNPLTHCCPLWLLTPVPALPLPLPFCCALERPAQPICPLANLCNEPHPGTLLIIDNNKGNQNSPHLLNTFHACARCFCNWIFLLVLPGPAL